MNMQTIKQHTQTYFKDYNISLHIKSIAGVLGLPVLASTYNQLHWPTAWAPPLYLDHLLCVYEFIKHRFTEEEKSFWTLDNEELSWATSLSSWCLSVMCKSNIIVRMNFTSHCLHNIICLFCVVFVCLFIVDFLHALHKLEIYECKKKLYTFQLETMVKFMAIIPRYLQLFKLFVR